MIHMMLTKLIHIASPAISKAQPVIDESLRQLGGPLVGELLELLGKKNGFYAFESALHVFPTQSTESEVGLDVWNSENLWRKEYDRMADGLLFFAEDVFGGQFCINDGGVYLFDPETAQLEHLANDLDGWANKVVADYEVLTGYPIAHQWQETHGILHAGRRLNPKIPFVAGGEFSIDNLYLVDSVKSMRYRASLANQIRNLPDGQQIRLKIIE